MFIMNRNSGSGCGPLDYDIIYSGRGITMVGKPFFKVEKWRTQH
jgi:hypothetical protein